MKANTAFIVVTPHRVTGVSLPAMLRKGYEIVGFDFYFVNNLKKYWTNFNYNLHIILISYKIIMCWKHQTGNENWNKISFHHYFNLNYLSYDDFNYDIFNF